MNNELLPFHDGVFRIAQKAYAPVVVLTVRGTEKIKKNYPFHKTTFYFDVSAVYDKDTVKRTRTSELGAQIYNLMDETIKKGDVLN
jgi:1-acyl-sn-glycerol-3-phosphate acyltransferase